ncbi:hypothetical protein BDF22DRAFT_106242 [Syncephalis plumigaleata]|nr:hypothetical protein BDF22DRAFT_106242 [Syncephalis plumigaleata]
MLANLFIGDHPIDTFAQRYVMGHQRKLGLSNIRWSGGNDENLRLARVVWDKQDAFMKCDIATNEVDAFKALWKAKKKLTGVYTKGRENVMDPLYQFDFYEENGSRYFCHLYSFINGVLLENYLEERTFSQAYILASEILIEVIKGSIYLYNAGILQDDLLPKNIMLVQDSNRKIIGVKIIDLDATSVIKKEKDWKLINLSDEEYLSPNPRQYDKSCDELKRTIAKFLLVFVSLKQGENPFDPNYRLTVNEMQDYLQNFKDPQYLLEQTIFSLFFLRKAREARASIGSELGNAEAAIPAMRYLLKVYYTLISDPFTCSSPIRALKGLPPRIRIPSRPNSPSF